MAGELITTTITGVEEVQQMLRDAPRNVVARAFLKGFEAAAEPIEAELEIRTPVREATLWNDESFSEFRQQTGGDLKAALMHETTLDASFRGGSLEVGFGKQGHVALWVEMGHRMVGHKPGKKLLGNVPAHPFMTPAADASADAAIDAFANVLVATLREGI